LAVLTALAEQLPTTVFSAQDGLHTTVSQIVVDSKGFVWFPGREGLARFDGNGFHMFTPADGLPARAVSAVFERADSTYWVAVGEHLCLFDPRSIGKRFQCESQNLGAILALLEDERGLWCGTQTGLWRRLKSGTQSWESVRGLEPADATHSTEVSKLLKDSRGDVWALTYAGLFRLHLNGRVEHWTLAQGLEMDKHTALSETPGSIWAGSQSELFRFSIDPRSGDAAIANRYGRSHGLPSGYVGDVRFWRGQVWAATFLGLARQLPSGRWQAVELDAGIREFPLNVLAIDALGNLWAGTDSGGAVRISGSGLSSFSEREGLSVRNVWAVFEDRLGNLMAVTKDEGRYLLNRFDGYRFHPVRLNAPASITFGWSWSQIVVHSRSGDWWLATGNGLLRYPHGIQATPALLEGLPRHSNIFRLFEDSRGGIWISIRARSDNRLYRRDPENGRLERFGDADGLPPLHQDQNVPSALVEDRTGAVWIGMWSGGLVRYRNGRFQQFSPSSGAPRQVRALLVDGQGRVWIGSNGEGLLRVDDPSAEHPVFSVYTRSNGLSNEAIQALTEDLNGRIYVAGDASIDRVDPRLAPGIGRIHHFTSNDGGLRAGFRVAFRDRRGALWFGGNQGLLRIEPQKDSSNPPNVLVYAMLVNGQRRPISDLGEAQPVALSLSSSERQLQVDFGGLRHDLLYQTRLSGIDRDWSPPSSARRVHYLSLAPGGYELAIRAVTPDGTFSTVPARVRFRIAAPVWERWWFLLLSSGALTGIFYAIHGYRLRHAVAIERVRTRLAADLHDDLGSGLAEIAILTEVAGQREPLLGLDAVARRARELRAAMSDIVWSVDPSGDSLEELINRWRQTAFALLGEGGLEFLAPPAEETSRVKLAPDQRRELLLFFKEIATNVARHAGAKHARICVQTEGKRLRLEVRDDGCGFDPERNDRGAGLKSMHRRAEALHGSLKIDSQPGFGATVTLSVPLLTA
jgi:ligand-binding sensor domain-containing protein/signal transduction histidine kinase